MQRFKIGLVWKDGKDQWEKEGILDLNEGWPDRRGRIKNAIPGPRYEGVKFGLGGRS